MQQHSLFRLEALCATVFVINVLGFVLDASSFVAVTFIWAFYVLVFAILSVRQTGIRGLGLPSLAYVATAILHPPVASFVLGVWMICTLFCVPVAFASRARKPTVDTRTDRQSNGLEPVSIAVPQTDASADLLTRLGLGSE